MNKKLLACLTRHLSTYMIGLFCIFSFSSIAQVTLTDLGTTVVLDNVLLKATLEKGSGKVLSMLHNGVEVFQKGTNHSGIYWSWNGGTGFGSPGNCAYTIKYQDANMVDLSFKSAYSGAGMPMDLDIHYVLRSNESELYIYNTIDHKAAYPAMDLGEFRIVAWMKPDPANTNEWLYENTYHGDGVRDFKLPSPFDFSQSQPTGIGEIIKLTTGARAGLYDSKYSYSTALWEHPVVGNASDVNDKGMFALFPSLEYFNEGPMYHDLVNGADVIHVYLNGDHYDGATISVPAGETYKKFMGPFSLYCNNKTTGAAAFADAKVRRNVEAAAWPYTWLNYNTDYPQANARGKATGTLSIVDPAKPTINGGGAWIGLTQIAATNTRNDFMFESNNYHFWVKTGAGGAFTIPNVRPGTYKLFAYQDGVVGQFEKTDVVITAGGNNNLGTLNWNVARTNGNLVWEIGVNNRSSKEFRFGSDKYFDGFNQEKIQPNYTNPLDYNVADNNWSSKLNYAHIGYPNAAGTNDTWKWNINFNLTNLPATGNALLTIAYASAGNASQGVFVNSSVQFARFYPPQGSGNAFVRQSNFGKYSFYKLTIPVDSLRNGANTIGLVTSPNGHVMYDYISLEVPGATGVGPTLDGTYVITVRHSGRAVDVEKLSLIDGGNVQQWSVNNGTNQRWMVNSVGGGYYSIMSVNSGKAIDVLGSSLTDSADVVQWTYTGGASQLWKITPLGGGYYSIINKNSGKALEVTKALTTNGADIRQWTYTGATNQQFFLSPASSVNLAKGGTDALQQEQVASDVKVSTTPVYPNPSLSVFTIKATGKFKYTIQNIAGQTIARGIGNSATNIGATLKKGVYIIAIDNGIEKKNFKVVKE